MVSLRTPRRRRFAGAERCSRVSQKVPNPAYDRVRASEHAPRGPFHLLERIYGLAHIVERGIGISAERLRVSEALKTALSQDSSTTFIFTAHAAMARLLVVASALVTISHSFVVCPDKEVAFYHKSL